MLGAAIAHVRIDSSPGFTMKPHIFRDGTQWRCEGGGGYCGIGPSPAEAYRKWLSMKTAALKAQLSGRGWA